jgi:SAM-dependent methyltransferase
LRVTPVVLRCVNCGESGTLIEAADSLRCTRCGTSFPRHRHKGIPVLVAGDSPLNVADILQHEVKAQRADLRIAMAHWRTGGLGKLLNGLSGTLLNYGSGDGGDRLWLEGQGFQVTTFDVYPGDYTDFVCDGHALPFADGQFSVVTSVAVFEHLYDPYRAAAEIFRVLKAGGALVGSVAFLEPYHARSYFHMSPLGIREVLTRAGFAEIEIHPGWSFVEALNLSFWAWNFVSPIHKLSSAGYKLCYRCGLALHRLAYRLKGRRPPDELELQFAGSLLFKAVKP